MLLIELLLLKYLLDLIVLNKHVFRVEFLTLKPLLLNILFGLLRLLFRFNLWSIFAMSQF